jgi:hypothetical protein
MRLDLVLALVTCIDFNTRRSLHLSMPELASRASPRVLISRRIGRPGLQVVEPTSKWAASSRRAGTLLERDCRPASKRPETFRGPDARSVSWPDRQHSELAQELPRFLRGMSAGSQSHALQYAGPALPPSL